jgi:rhamnulokinase
MVGGGTANKLLCQFTADACDLPVYAGVDQCTAVGNALIQAVGLGALGGPADIRRVTRDSFQLTAYQPRNQPRWNRLGARYAELTACKRAAT